MARAPLDRIAAAAAPLAIGVSVLLFAQWPLRQVPGGWAIQANDLAQWLFAVYVAVAVTHAQRRRGHLVARPDLAGTRWRRAGGALAVLPWSLFLVVTAAAPGWRSVVALERFPETLDPGYFMIRVALLLLGLLMAAQALADLRAAWRG